jgi:HPt (histidine-containing phosphotransfer) domain-containing protein
MKPGIDPETLLRVVGNAPDMAREVVQDFLPAAQSGIAEIRAAVEGAAAGKLSAACHKLKGSASLVGAHQLTALCVQLETASEVKDWPAIHRLTPQLEGLMRDIETSAEAFLRSQTL